MSIKQLFAKKWAKRAVNSTNKWAQNPIATQEKTLKMLLQKAKKTAFGQDHGFSQIENHEDFAKQVPIRDYEGLRPYVDRVVCGRSRYLMARETALFFENIGNHVWGKVYSHFKRVDADTYKNRSKRIVSLHLPFGEYIFC